MIRLTLIAATALTLAACGRAGDGNGTQISFSSNSADGAVTGGIDNQGNLKIDTGGFKADVKLPKLDIKADDFDMNGVKLYPGSTITNLNILGQPGAGEGEKADGKVSVSFSSPATPVTVRDWLKSRLGQAGFTVTTAGNGLTGKTNDGKPFALTLSEDGAGKSKGVIDMGG